MSRLLPWALMFVVVAVAAPAQAQDDEPRCNPDGTQFEMNLCAADEYAAADAELNSAWKQLLAALGDDAVALARARAAQRAWIAFRDAEVAAHFPVADGDDPRVVHGSVYPLLQHGLLTELTRNRSAQLRTRIDELQAP